MKSYEDGLLTGLLTAWAQALRWARSANETQDETLFNQANCIAIDITSCVPENLRERWDEMTSGGLEGAEKVLGS